MGKLMELGRSLKGRPGQPSASRKLCVGMHLPVQQLHDLEGAEHTVGLLHTLCNLKVVPHGFQLLVITGLQGNQAAAPPWAV